MKEKAMELKKATRRDWLGIGAVIFWSVMMLGFILCGVAVADSILVLGGLVGLAVSVLILLHQRINRLEKIADSMLP